MGDFHGVCMRTDAQRILGTARSHVLPSSPGRLIAIVQQLAAPREIEKGHALLGGAARDAKEVAAIATCEAAVSFGQVGRDRQGRSLELIDKKSAAARKRVGERADGFGEVDRFFDRRRASRM